MAFKIQHTKPINAVEIISRNDEAIDREKSDFTKYDDDPIDNKDAIVLKPGMEPTIFLCNFQLTGSQQAAIQNAMLTGVDENNQPKMTIGSWAYSVVKHVLKDIRNPANEADCIQFKRLGNGLVHDDTMTLLSRYGLINEIFNHYVNLTQTDVGKNIKN